MTIHLRACSEQRNRKQRGEGGCRNWMSVVAKQRIGKGQNKGLDRKKCLECRNFSNRNKKISYY